MRGFLAEIANKAEHFHHFGNIYNKLHKANDLGKTSENIST